jgi:DNA-binding transcriptional MocR family regulator
MAKYRQLFERYRDLIVSGAYGPGERLPSLREISGLEAVSLNTVRSAYSLLESEGLARPRERGGYFVSSRPGLSLRGLVDRAEPPDSCREVEGLSTSQKIDYLLSAGGARGGFALAEPDDSLLPLARLERLHATLQGSWIGYGEGEGEEELRRRIAVAWEPWNGPMEPSQVIVTNGATEALDLVTRGLLEAGDIVAVESPTYYDFFRHLAAARARVVEVPLRRGSGMDLDLLERLLKRGGVKMVIVQPNVQNPTGTLMADADKARLLALAERHGSILVQDDVYGDLAFSQSRPRNLGSFGDYGRLVYISSFSKVLAPGLRVGWLSSPAYGRELARAKTLSSLATNRPAQRVIASFLGGTTWRRHLAGMRQSLELQLRDYLEILAEALPEGSRLTPPAGGCLLWLALPAGTDASRLFEIAAKEGIAAAPGELFSSDPFFRGHVRINFGHPLTERRRRGLVRLATIARGLSGAKAVAAAGGLA